MKIIRHTPCSHDSYSMTVVGIDWVNVTTRNECCVVRMAGWGVKVKEVSVSFKVAQQLKCIKDVFKIVRPRLV